jgi:SAM-dependent methyltransferase
MPLATDALPSFVRWQQEAEKHWRAGDYAWMAGLVDAQARVLEVGCGVGYSTLALSERVGALMTIEPDADCRAIAEARLREAGTKPVHFVGDAVGALPEVADSGIRDFAPDWMVCWLMGAADAALDAMLPPAQAVQKHREAVHRQAAELAARLPSVKVVQFVDRTAFPWKIKDTARETLAMYHAATTFAGLPFSPDIKGAIYRKLDERMWPAPAQKHGSGPSIVPVLGALQVARDA